MSQPTLVKICESMLKDKNHVILTFPGVKASTVVRDVGSADVLFHLEILNHDENQGEYIVAEYMILARTGFNDETGLDITVFPMYHQTKNSDDVDKEIESNYLAMEYSQ